MLLLIEAAAQWDALDWQIYYVREHSYVRSNGPSSHPRTFVQLLAWLQEGPAAADMARPSTRAAVMSPGRRQDGAPAAATALEPGAPQEQSERVRALPTLYLLQEDPEEPARAARRLLPSLKAMGDAECGIYYLIAARLLRSFARRASASIEAANEICRHCQRY